MDQIKPPCPNICSSSKHDLMNHEQCSRMAESEVLNIYECSAQIDLLFWSLKQITKDIVTTNCMKIQSDWYEQCQFSKSIRKITGKLCCDSKNKLHNLVLSIMKEIQFWFGVQHLNKCQGGRKGGTKVKESLNYLTSYLILVCSRKHEQDILTYFHFFSRKPKTIKPKDNTK